MDKLTQFFEDIKNISFWKRIFGWSQIRNLSYDAYEEFKTLLQKLETANSATTEVNNKLSLIEKENEHLRESKPEFAVLKEKVSGLEIENKRLDIENSNFKQTEITRKNEHERSLATLASVQTRIENERRDEVEEKQRKELERLENLKKTWSQHQDKVKEFIKSLCQKHAIEYAESFPYKGTPDNAIKIADEYVIFDAKSPASPDELNNFPLYLKSESEKAKKYTKEEDVKKDVYLVVPSNVVQAVKQFVYNLSDYKVYVITLDALEPVILSLKKLEDYEFIDQLSPEERDNISRVIGKFAHLTKRRIQVDQYFGMESLELLSKTAGSLPTEVLDSAVEYEKSEKLNPPTDKRTKLLSGEELRKGSGRIQKEAEVKGIASAQDIKIEE